jgi:RNA polymerase sigma-70 factor, ECF subfamily
MSPSDLYQETLVAALQHFRTFHGESSGEFHGWLTTILLNTARDYFRASMRHKRDSAREVPLTPSEGEGLPAGCPSPESSPLDASIRREMSVLIRNAVRQLPDPDREVLLLRFHEQLSIRDVGSALGISPGAAQQRVTRTVNKVAGILDGLPPEVRDSW